MKFFGRRNHHPQVTITSQLSGPTFDFDSPVEIAGTTTTDAGSLTELFASHGLADGGLLEVAGQLMREGSNPVDPNAVAVHVQRHRIGYLPGYMAAHLPPDKLGECRVQLWGANTPKGVRVRGWVSSGYGPAAWPHTAANPPAVTTEERRNEQAAATTRMVNQALAGGGRRAEEFKRGMVGQLHYLETVEPIKQFKREGRLTEALALCYGAIAAAENDRDGREPAPWYTEQAAIIHRKLGQRDKEEAVLQRWLDACPPSRREGSSIKLRLEKLTG